MAPMKRPAASSAGAAAKHAKKEEDPISLKCLLISDSLKGVPDEVVPATALDMLLPMIKPCLSTPKVDRHEFQVSTVETLAKTLTDVREHLESDAASKTITVADALKEKEARLEAASTAQAEFEKLTAKTATKQEAVKAAQSASVKAAAEVKEMTKAAADLESVKAKTEKKKAELNEGLQALELFSSVAADSSDESKAALKALQKACRTFQVEPVLSETAAKAVKKEVNSRLEFDTLTMAHLKDHLSKLAAEADAELEAMVPTLASAEKSVEVAKEAATAAAEALPAAEAELKAAKELQKEASSAVVAAEKKRYSWLADMKASMNAFDVASQTLKDYLEGAVASFEELKELPPPAELPVEAES